MAITATNEGGSGFEPIAAGTYAARCYSMVHIGTLSEPYMGQVKEQNKVRITWELPTELKEFKEGEGEKPYVISKDYALSLYEKANLRKHIDSWRGKALTEDEAKCFDITKLLGVDCLISIIHKTSADGKKTYPEITSISRLPKGMVCPAQINPIFEFNYDPFDQEKFMSLPEWLRKKMETTPEYKKAIGFTPAQQDAMHGEVELMHRKMVDEIQDEDPLPF